MPCTCLKLNFSIFKINKNYTWRLYFVGPLVFAKRLPEGECFASCKWKKARKRRSTTPRRRKALKFAPAKTHEHFRRVSGQERPRLKKILRFWNLMKHNLTPSNGMISMPWIQIWQWKLVTNSIYLPYDDNSTCTSEKLRNGYRRPTEIADNEQNNFEHSIRR